MTSSSAAAAFSLAEAARGSEISLCVCSRGEAGSNGTPEEREAEAEAAADILGATLAFLDFGGDSHIEASNANALALARHIRATSGRTCSWLRSPRRINIPTTPSSAIFVDDAARLARYGGIAELRDLPPHTITHHFGYAVTPGAEPARDQPQFASTSARISTAGSS